MAKEKLKQFIVTSTDQDGEVDITGIRAKNEFDAFKKYLEVCGYYDNPDDFWILKQILQDMPIMVAKLEGKDEVENLGFEQYDENDLEEAGIVEPDKDEDDE
jgi:hypothetical protein